MVLDKVDPNTMNGGSHRQPAPANGDASRTNGQQSAQKANVAEGDLFQSENIGNKFSFKADVLKKYKDAEQRGGDEGNLQSKGATPERPISPGQAEQNPVSQESTAANNETTANRRTLPNTPMDNRFPTQEPVESPTWRRKFSLIPNYNYNGTLNGLGRAFKFGRTKKDAPPEDLQVEYKKQSVDASEEATRIRASNLVTSLIAGAPAALFLASNFQNDEHGTRRAPLLLSLLAVTVQDITERGTKHRKYKLNLEYGVGDNRLKWSVIKDHRDFLGLHSRLKLSLFQSKNFKGQKSFNLPKFPRMDGEGYQGGRTLNDDYLSPTVHIQDHEEPADLKQGLGGTFDRKRPSRRPSNATMASSQSSGFRERLYNITSVTFGDIADPERADDYRNKLEVYLKTLITDLSLRPQANKLFQFFELSPLGVLLSYETGYQGKQGYLIVSSTSKAQGWRVGHWKISDLKQMVERHTNKWFLVRSSYVMYVSDIYSTTPLDVFMVDRHFKVTFSGSDDLRDFDPTTENEDEHWEDGLSVNNQSVEEARKFPHFVIKLENGERELKVIAKSEKQAKLWVHSFLSMQKNTIWSKPNRFDSFAPVRQNCFAQWFVDGRDHMWAVSSAMEMAKDTIYIHDWWLSPELYMRRPANGNQEWRLDRILKRKAEEGVKIFVIIYRNVGSTVVTDSLWTKHSLIDLHPNVHVLRSPNQWLQNTYFWAHHEKLCVVDHTVAFVGGIDLCYGRYDTPDHVLVDDSPHDFANNDTPTEDSIKYQTFPGKDYSNPREKDFYDLDKPYESMYDREKVPRMPWHDVHMMTAGQPARDLSRHFVQRWNYLLRQKRPSRPTPILTPPPEFLPEDLERFDLTGTCEVQLLRSSGNWSLGLKKTEHSIQNAYLKLIETSQHYIYIENQFFVTASAFDGVVIENRIGDALVDRIIQAHNNKRKWKAFIIIPLMPGFESQVDEAEGSAVRVIMQCQYQSISRGPTSIFAKLKKMKINPYDYIQFFSLRKWGRIGPDRQLVSEQLYIHAKILIVDDRTALIGSANINERSQRGNRDSEVAAVVRDTELVNSTMNGQPYQASKFAHTLRMRLMREHLGVDVDILDIVERRFNKIEELAKVTKTGRQCKTNNFKVKDNEVASAMVELASRDVLNMPEGTQKWKKFQKQANMFTETTAEDEQQFNEINGSDDKQNLPAHLQEKSHEPVSLIFHSFNNRAREENAGIRDKKQFSSDARILNNQEHKSDVNGTHDGLGSKTYVQEKINAATTLKQWARDSLVGENAKVFLPNATQLLEFLNDDGEIVDPGSLTEEEELMVAERNQEKWEMLKRIAYLQRVAAKIKQQIDEENGKRAKVNLPPVFSPESQDASVQAVDKVASGAADPEETDFLGASAGTADTRTSNDMGEIDVPSGDTIPVVSLDDDGLQGLLDTINNEVNIESGTMINKFIDPYSFHDPLIDSFYEEVWFANAHRNTLLFREVFHVQPDDTVTSWADYKKFNKLNTAFRLAQEQEARRREALREQSVGQDTTLDTIGTRNGTVRVPDSTEMRRESVFGEIPGDDSQREGTPSADVGDGNGSGGQFPKRGKSGAYAFRKRSPLGGDFVYERETADKVLSEIQGHLVIFPADWLYGEIESGNWYHNMDRIPPIEIYD